MLQFQTSIKQYGDDLTKDIGSALDALSKKSLLLGVIRDESRVGLSRKKRELTNSELAFIHEFGAPEAKIPARPFLFPTLRAHRDTIKQFLNMAIQEAMASNDLGVDQTLHALGMILRDAVKKRILDFIPPKLSDVTLNWWITKNKQRKDYGTTPLKVTGQFINSIDYVVENRQ